MEAIFLACGAGGPQLKRNPLGGGELMFCTVLHSLKSPTNVGGIVRSHVAFGGSEVVFVGYREPWSFRKGSQAFSRKLERLCELVFLRNDAEYFAWASSHGYSTVAVEVSEHAFPIHEFSFPLVTALAFGNEAAGLSESFLAACDAAVRIPQFGPVGSLNVAAAAAIAMHELLRGRALERPVLGHKFVAERAE